MGAMSQSPRLALDLSIGPADTLIWNPTGLDIFVDLKIAEDDLGVVLTSPSRFDVCLHRLVDIGDGCRETLDDHSEPTRNVEFGRGRSSPAHLHVENLLSDAGQGLSGNGVWSLTSSAERERGRTKQKDNGNNVKLQAESHGTNHWGLDISLDLEIPTAGVDIVPTSPSNIQGCLHAIVDSGDRCGGNLDFQSESGTSLPAESRQLCPGYVHQEDMLHEGTPSSSGNEVLDHTCPAEPGSDRAKISENGNNAKLSAERDGTSEMNRDVAANLPSGAEMTTDGCLGSNLFAIDDLDEDDILAACQLLVLSHEGEEVDETSAVCRLRELSECLRKDGYYDDILSRSASGKISAPMDVSGIGTAQKDACTASADENFDKENYCLSGNGMMEDASSDLRTLKLKRIKPKKGPSDKEYEKIDDWDVLDRPLHKRRYKSLRQIYHQPPPDI